MKKKKTDLLEGYVSLLKTSIDDQGIYPMHAAIGRNDGTNEMLALALPPEQLYEVVRQKAGEDYRELLFGLDRTNAENQGVDTKYTSVFTFAHYKDGGWRTGVLPYSNPKNIGEVSWDNAFWKDVVDHDLKMFGFIDPTLNDAAVGSAYSNKLKITHYRNSSTGQKYEGVIETEQLSPDVKEFLQENELHINDRRNTIDFFATKGINFEFTREDLGFWTLKAGKGIFPARGSKSKVYLEGVEASVRELIKESAKS